MSCDPTFEWCNELQADPTAAQDDSAAKAADAQAADDTAAGAADEKKAKAGPPRAVVTKVAVKFVNAMWATMFARVLSVGLQEWTRSVRQYNVQTSSVQAKMDLSTPYSAYKYQGYMLISWGLYGWSAFLAKRFMKGSDLVKKMTLMGAQGTGVFGLALLGLSLWRTFGRDNCSTTSSW